MNGHNKKSEDNIIKVTGAFSHRLLDNTYTLEFLETTNGWDDQQILRNLDFAARAIAVNYAVPRLALGLERIYITDINEKDLIKITVEDGKVETTLDQELFANTYPAIDLKPYKVNQKTGAIKIANAIRLLAKIYTDAVSEHYKLEEKLIKAYSTALKPKEYYLYKASNNFAELSQLVNMKTNTRSCMMRESIDGTLSYVYGASNVLLDRYENAGAPSEKVVGRNWQHPFISYEGTNDTVLLLVSERKLKDGEEITEQSNPFIKRAIAQDSSYTYKDRRVEEYSFAREYGADCMHGLHRYFDKANECGNTDDMVVRIYQTELCVNVAPYVDGDSQYGSQVRTEGAHCNLFKLPATVVVITDDESVEWKLYSTTGAEENVRYHTCAVDGEDYDEEDMIFIDEIDDWVCANYAYWDSNRDEYRLDGKAILNYFR